jgi:hypothetical protein
MPIYLHILPTPLYTVAVARVASLCPLKTIYGCSSGHLCTKSLTSSSTLNFISSHGLFEWAEQVKIALRQVMTLGGLWQYPQCISCNVPLL